MSIEYERERERERIKAEMRYGKPEKDRELKYLLEVRGGAAVVR